MGEAAVVSAPTTSSVGILMAESGFKQPIEWPEFADIVGVVAVGLAALSL
jgi:hypothetical protein